MQIVPALLFGISASLDALLVGMTFGIRGASIPFRHNLLIGMITLLGTCLSVGLGSGLTLLLSAHTWTLLGSLILIAMGIFYITKFMMVCFQKDRKHQSLTATQAPAALTTPETCSLGIALSANNMGIGLSASVAGLALLPAAIVTLVFSFIFLLLGNRLGQHPLLRLTEDSVNLLTGLMLILLGAVQIMS